MRNTATIRALGTGAHAIHLLVAGSKTPCAGVFRPASLGRRRHGFCPRERRRLAPRGRGQWRQSNPAGAGHLAAGVTENRREIKCRRSDCACLLSRRYQVRGTRRCCAKARLARRKHRPRARGTPPTDRAAIHRPAHDRAWGERCQQRSMIAFSIRRGWVPEKIGDRSCASTATTKCAGAKGN